MRAPTERQLAEFGNDRKHLFLSDLTDIFRDVNDASILHHTFLLVCYQHALRAQEVCNIRLEDLDMRQKLLRTERLKGGLDTTQDIVQVKGNPLICELTALKSWLAERVEHGGQFLFNSQKAERFHPSTLTRIFKKYCQIASEDRIARGLKPIPKNLWHLHVLRHTAITNLCRTIDNPIKVQQWVGHKNLATTMIYAHPSMRESGKAVLKATYDIFA